MRRPLFELNDKLLPFNAKASRRLADFENAISHRMAFNGKAMRPPMS